MNSELLPLHTLLALAPRAPQLRLMNLSTAAGLELLAATPEPPPASVSWWHLLVDHSSLDPLADGASGFILTLLSGAVLTFSPVDALRADAARACDPARFGMESYTDQDVDCLVRRRSICAFANDARYRWTHAMRPGVAVELQQEGGRPVARICDWWGTRQQLMERKEEQQYL